ncbi:MAG TPA: agmatinase family protein [Methanothrix sp.]|nr:agmatinase family protein [Methanothrix sp.]HRW82944.1 agmatinase family protein [Methanothrix sp.]
MFNRSNFADADAVPEEAEFVIVGAPFDATTCFRSGTREGPGAVRRASYNFETYVHRHGIDFRDITVADLGDLDLGADPAYARQTIRESFAFIPEVAIPIFIGGEHSITPPIVAEVARRHGNVGAGNGVGAGSGGGVSNVSNVSNGSSGKSGIGVLVLDAHLDLRKEYGGTKLSHACASRTILETDGVAGYASIGIRSGDLEEYIWAEENGVHYHSSDEVRERGIEAVLKDALKEVGCEKIYLSIDFDALDPAYAPGVGTPEPFGLSSWDVRYIVEKVAPKAIGLDVNEIAPQFDGGQTASLGAKLIREFIAAKAAANR